MGSIAVPFEQSVNPADAVFMRAIELADAANRARKPSDCQVLIEKSVRCRGLNGSLLRRTELKPSVQRGWGMGIHHFGGIGKVRMMLTSNGTIYFAPPSSALNGGSHGPMLCDVEELDHRHLGNSSVAESLLNKLDQFAAEARLG